MKKMFKVFLGILMVLGIIISISNFFTKTVNADDIRPNEKKVPKTLECYDIGRDCIWVNPETN